MGVPISEKYILTLKEAGEYFNLGDTKLRKLCEEVGQIERFTLFNGNRMLIKRREFEKFLDKTECV